MPWLFSTGISSAFFSSLCFLLFSSFSSSYLPLPHPVPSKLHLNTTFENQNLRTKRRDADYLPPPPPPDRMEIATLTPVAEFCRFDEFPDTSFDAFVDPDSLFDLDSYFHLDACAEGLAPEAATASTGQPLQQRSRQMSESGTLPDGLPSNRLSDLESLFGDAPRPTTPPAQTVSPAQLMLTLPGKTSDKTTQQQQQQQQTLVLPSIGPTQPGEDNGGFEALFAEMSGPIADAFQLQTAAPTPVQDCGSLALPTASWPADETDLVFECKPEAGAAELGFLAPQPSFCDTLDIFDSFDSFDVFDTPFPEIEQKYYPSPAGFFQTSSQGTRNLLHAPPTPPPAQSTESFESLFPDLASISAGEIPFTFDETSVDLLCSLPPVVSLTAPQPDVPRSVPFATLGSATKLVHPKPKSLLSASFIRGLSEPLADVTPSSILDSKGLLDVAAVSASYLTPAPTPTRDLVTPVVDGKVLKRIPRPTKAKDVDASDWYDALAEAPAAWGGHDPKSPMFQYNKEGELLPSLRFSREQIFSYMKGRKDQGLPLTLWIQNVPHGCKTRVADDRLRACRWSGCPAYKGTILKGFWRICFDERPATSGKQHDPYHNAGYMHLWCLDRCFDLFEISHAFDLRPDTRYFEKEERNPMAMTRDHDELVMEFEKWRTSQKAAYEEWQKTCQANKMLGLPTENRLVEREAKLWHVLTAKHLALETPVRSNMRRKRNGISIDKHKGDLEWYVERVNERKGAKKGEVVNYDEANTEDEGVRETQVSRLRAASNMKRKLEDWEMDAEDSGGCRRQPARHSKRLRRTCG
ncbi:hypothetical protein CTA2_2677 [Colletotrichum tanaceti]|uniref:Uncharacterized protein n=1 Tax=Colletotrichum tanaceti TaxID=1306861 RepID=A0A4U6XQH3_9PEZI|nr:hypothetical protein CTA2_2677 [Colletotrichum tanaceti]TKW58085.1 hypothetical protein CTA1_11082 [Colletotrichum tanaceti]